MRNNDRRVLTYADLHTLGGPIDSREPGRDIEIQFTGVRPGERLHEILFAHNEPIAEIGIAGIVAAKPSSPSVEAMRRWLATLEQGLARNDRSVIYGVLRDAVPDFRGEAA